MRRLVPAVLAAVLAAAPTAARADLFSSVSYGVHAGNTGVGITLEKPLLYDFSVRLETNTLSIPHASAYDGTRFDDSTLYDNVGIFGDWRPYGGRYRISGGLLFGEDRTTGVSQITGATMNVGNGVYPVSGTGLVTTTVNYDRPTMYLGVGTGTGLIPGFALDVDAGIEIRNGVASASASGPLAADPAFQADLARLAGEQPTRVVTPVVRIGLIFRP